MMNTRDDLSNAVSTADTSHLLFMPNVDELEDEFVQCTHCFVWFLVSHVLCSLHKFDDYTLHFVRRLLY